MVIAKTQVGSTSYFAESELPIGRFKSQMKAKAIAMESAAPTIVISTHNAVLPIAGRCRPTDSQPSLSLRRTMNIKSAANAQTLSSLSTTFRTVQGMWVELNNPRTNGIEKNAIARPITVHRPACRPFCAKLAGLVTSDQLRRVGFVTGAVGMLSTSCVVLLAGGSYSNRPTLTIRF